MSETTDRALLGCPCGKVEVVLTQQVGLLALVDEKGHVVATQFLDGGASYDALDNLAEAWNRRAPQSNGSRKLEEACRTVLEAHDAHERGENPFVPWEDLREALRNEQREPERDFTPEEALEEAKKRWGPEAWASFDTRSGTISGKKYGPFFVGVAVRDEKGEYHGISNAWNGKTFREAFAAADKESEQ